MVSVTATLSAFQEKGRVKRSTSLNGLTVVFKVNISMKKNCVVIVVVAVVAMVVCVISVVVFVIAVTLFIFIPILIIYECV